MPLKFPFPKANEESNYKMLLSLLRLQKDLIAVGPIVLL